MKYTSTLVLSLAVLVLLAGILLRIYEFPGAVMPLILGSLGLILGVILRWKSSGSK